MEKVELHKSINIEIKRYLETFNNIENLKYTKIEHEFDCNELNTDILNVFKSKIGKLNNKKPCLYYFDITKTKHSHQEILESFSNFQIGEKAKDKILEIDKKKKNKRTTSTIKHKNFNNLPETKCLYVGKVRENIASRLNVHLGFLGNGDTAGLQLCWWANNLNIKLKLHVFIFNTDMKDYMDLFELALARAEKPLIGKYYKEDGITK